MKEEQLNIFNEIDRISMGNPRKALMQYHGLGEFHNINNGRFHHKEFYNLIGQTFSLSKITETMKELRKEFDLEE